LKYEGNKDFSTSHSGVRKRQRNGEDVTNIPISDHFISEIKEIIRNRKDNETHI
jgi:hypothetical protein